MKYTSGVREDMERQRRVATYRKVADELLKQALGIKEHAGAGRPSRQTLRFREVRDVLLAAICADPSVDKEAPLNSVSLQEWLSGDYCQRVPVCADKDMLEELKSQRLFMRSLLSRHSCTWPMCQRWPPESQRGASPGPAPLKLQLWPRMRDGGGWGRAGMLGVGNRLVRTQGPALVVGAEVWTGAM